MALLHYFKLTNSHIPNRNGLLSAKFSSFTTEHYNLSPKKQDASPRAWAGEELYSQIAIDTAMLWCTCDNLKN